MQLGKPVKIDPVDLNGAKDCPKDWIGKQGKLVGSSRDGSRSLFVADAGDFVRWVPMNWIKGA